MTSLDVVDENDDVILQFFFIAYKVKDLTLLIKSYMVFWIEIYIYFTNADEWGYILKEEQ